MIVDRNFLNRLKAFGLNSYEAKIWTALLSRGIASAGELSDISNVPRSRSYDVLENLERKGFIIVKIGKPIKYIAIPPAEVLERVKKKIQTDAEKESVSLDKLKSSEILKELNLLHKNGVDVVEPSDLSGSLKTREHTYSQLNSMIRNAQKSISIMTTSKGLMRKLDYFRTAFERAKKRGVEIKIAAPTSKLDDELLNAVSRFADVRNVDEISARFAIVDNKEMIFMLMGDNADAQYDAGIWVNADFFVNSIQEMFNLVWENTKIRVRVR